MQVLWPVGIDIMPLAYEIAVVPFMVNGEKRIALQIATPAGVNFVFMECEVANYIADKIKESTGKIVKAPAGLIL